MAGTERDGGRRGSSWEVLYERRINEKKKTTHKQF